MPRPFIPDSCVGLWFPGRGHPEQRRGTVLDLSGQNNHGTIYGVPALYFDGAGDIATPGTLWDALSGRRYAVSAAWIYVITTGVEVTRTIYAENWNGSAEHRFQFLIDTSDKLRIRLKAGASGDTDRVSVSTNVFPETGWHSLLIMVDLGAASPWTPVASVWLDGAVFAMGAFSGNVSQGTFAANVPTTQRFGATTWGDYYFKGYLQWLGFGGVDTPLAIVDAQRFHDFPQAWLAASGLDAYWFCKEDVNGTVDNAEGTAGRDLTMTGATWNSLITAANGGDARNAAGTANSGDSFNSGYRFFDGVDDCLQVANAASLIFGTAPYQIHVWANIPVGVAAASNICGKGLGAAAEWFLTFAGGGPNVGKLEFVADNSAIDIMGTSDVRDGITHLLSLLRNGNTVNLYIDGVQEATGSAAHDLTTTKVLQLMAADGANPCQGQLFKALFGTKNVSIANAEADMLALRAQGPFK